MCIGSGGTSRGWLTEKGSECDPLVFIGTNAQHSYGTAPKCRAHHTVTYSPVLLLFQCVDDRRKKNKKTNEIITDAHRRQFKQIIVIHNDDQKTELSFLFSGGRVADDADDSSGGGAAGADRVSSWRRF